MSKVSGRQGPRRQQPRQKGKPARANPGRGSGAVARAAHGPRLPDRRRDEGNLLRHGTEIRDRPGHPRHRRAGHAELESPTGKSAKVKLVFIAKVNTDGLIEEDRTYFDNLDFMKQLGLIE